MERTTRRAAAFHGFVTTQLPPPARLLEIGCGQGELARDLADAGYDVVAIDPQAPEGPLFRQVRLEEFTDSEGFDGVVASVSLHHIDDVAAALDKIVALLRPGGVLVLEEFANEHLAGPTARWYYHQRRSLAETGRTDAEVPDDFDVWEREGAANRADIHAASEIRDQLGRRFAERFFEWTPYLYSWGLDDTVEALERRLIADGAIEATGFWYCGEPR